MGSMRSTLSIDDDVFEELGRYAAARGLRLGKAASELLRRGLHAPCPIRLENGFVVVDLPPDSPVVTSDHVRELEAESL